MGSTEANRMMGGKAACWLAVVVAGLSAFGDSPLRARMQQSSPQAPASIFKSGVELVAVDVSVVDGDGRPVKGLRPDQFAVTIDGKPRRVASAEFVEFISATPAPPVPAWPGRRLFSSNLDASGQPIAPGRFIYLAVDQGSFRVAGASGAMEAARKFIDRLQPSDRVGLVTFPQPGPFVQASQDHAPARAATEQIVGSAESLQSQLFDGRIGLGEAIDIKAGDQRVYESVVRRECGQLSGPAAVACQDQVTMEAHSLSQSASVRGRRSIDGLQAIVRNLAKVRERKTLVLISAGLPVADRPGTALEFSGEIAAIARDAAAANLVLYVLHIDSSDLEATSAVGFRRTGRPDSLWRDTGMMRAGLGMLAGVNGGSLATVVAGADVAFDRVLRETAAAYLLGVEPTGTDSDGKSHPIKVTVNVAGAQVRSRAEVTMPGKVARPANKDEVLSEVLRAPRVATALPVRVTTLTTAQESVDGLVVLVSAEIGEGLTEPIEMQVGYVILDASGAASALVSQKTRLTPRATSKAGSASFLVNAILKPGSYVLRIAATEPSGRAGSAEHPFTVGLHDGDDVRAGDLLLLDPLRGKDEGAALLTDGQLWGDSVNAYIDFVPRPGHPVPTTVTFGLADRPEAALLLSHQVAASKKGDSDPLAAGAHLDLRRVLPGDYFVVAEIGDGSRRFARIERPIHIEHRAVR